MTDQQFLERADTVFKTVEDCLDATDLDLDIVRSGNVMAVEFPSGNKLVINTQQPLHEMWMAAATGGYHFRWSDQAQRPGWRDTRSDEEFFKTLERLVSEQVGSRISLLPRA